jgi:hypothetical protein
MTKAGYVMPSGYQPAADPEPVDSDCGCEHESVEIHGKIRGTVRTNPEAADYGSFVTFTFTGVAGEPAQRLLGMDLQRSRAVISVQTGSATIGKKENINSGLTAQGFLQTSTAYPLEVRNKQEIWALAVTGAACVISVLNERWDNEPT